MTEKEKIKFRKNLTVYFSLLKNYKLYVFSIIFFVLIVECTRIIEKFLFKKITDDGTSFISGEIGRNTLVEALFLVAIVYIAISITKIVSKWINSSLLNLLDAKMVFDLKEKFFKHILGLSHNFHTTHKTGSLISRLLRGSGASESMNDVLMFDFVPLVTQLVMVFSSIALFSVLPAIILLITVIVFIGYSVFIQSIQQSSKLKLNDAEDSEKGFISDIFTNIDSIKYFGKESRVNWLFQKVINRTKSATVRYGEYYIWFDSGHSLILAIGTFFLIYFPIIDFIEGRISLGTLVFIYTVFSSVVAQMFGFVWGMRRFYRALADSQDLFEYLDFENEIKDKPDAKELEIREGEIEFKDVGFKYGKRTLFNKFNLKINKNEKIALVGHSGSGKTSLVKLLYRFYDIPQGQILVDGKDIREFKQESLRSEMGIVPQECVLFDDTIFNNIKFSKPDASYSEVIRAIKFAQLDKIIAKFPNKEDTIVGERGVRLSGGEKQRVSIARAILANKKVMVLDEATSSLDSETEHEIQKDLRELLSGRTAIIIAHRLSTIMHADRIIVIKNGKIVQEGKHRNLIRQPGEYRHLWELQRGGYIE